MSAVPVSAGPVATSTNRWGWVPYLSLVVRLKPFGELIRPYRRWLASFAAAQVVTDVCLIASGAVGALLVGRAVTGSPQSELGPLLVALVLLVIPSGITGFLTMWTCHVASYRLMGDLRKQMYARFDALSPSYFVHRRTGDVASAAMSDIELIELFTSHTLPVIPVAVIVPTGALVALGFIHPLLPLVLAPFLVAFAIVPHVLRQRATREGLQARQALAGLGADTVDRVQGLREIVAFGATDRALATLERRQDDLGRASRAHGRRVGYEKAAGDVLLSVGVLATVALASWLVTTGRLDRSTFPVAVVLAGGAFAPMTGLASVGRELNRVAGAADRIVELLRAEPAVADLVPSSPAAPDEAVVAFRNVSFRYRPELPLVLDDVSFEVRPGETVALVGHSGAGKTTCTQLLLRMWDPESGSITVGGHDLRAWRQDDLRALMAPVPQETYLFGISVEANVGLAHDHPDAEAVRDAAEAAQAREFIEALPDGWQTVLGERGTSLSGGQRQRLAVARALVKGSPIVILDEAVSSLDSEAERALEDAVAKATTGRTTLVVAHRPSTIRAADRVVVLDHGRVVESGTYDELMAAGGALATLLATTAATTAPGPAAG